MAKYFSSGSTSGGATSPRGGQSVPSEDKHTDRLLIFYWITWSCQKAIPAWREKVQLCLPPRLQAAWTKSQGALPPLLLLWVREVEPVCFKNQSQNLLQHTFDLFPTLIYSSCSRTAVPRQLEPEPQRNCFHSWWLVTSRGRAEGQMRSFLLLLAS